MKHDSMIETEVLPLTGEEVTQLLLAGAGFSYDVGSLRAMALRIAFPAPADKEWCDQPEDWGGCQWIEGEPSWRDDSKCLMATLPGEAWCARHRARVFSPAIRAVQPWRASGELMAWVEWMELEDLKDRLERSSSFQEPSAAAALAGGDLHAEKEGA